MRIMANIGEYWVIYKIYSTLIHSTRALHYWLAGLFQTIDTKTDNNIHLHSAVDKVWVKNKLKTCRVGKYGKWFKWTLSQKQNFGIDKYWRKFYVSTTDTAQLILKSSMLPGFCQFVNTLIFSPCFPKL